MSTIIETYVSEVYKEVLCPSCDESVGTHPAAGCGDETFYYCPECELLLDYGGWISTNPKKCESIDKFNEAVNENGWMERG